MNGATSAVLTPISTEMLWDAKIGHGLKDFFFGGGAWRGDGEGMREYLTRWIARKCQ